MSTYPQVVDVPALQSELAHARDEAERARRELIVERSKAEGLRGQLANAEVAMRLANVGSERDLRHQLADLTASHREQEVSDSMTIRTLRADRVALLAERRELVTDLAQCRRANGSLRTQVTGLTDALGRLHLALGEAPGHFTAQAVPDPPGDRFRAALWPRVESVSTMNDMQRVDAQDRALIHQARAELLRAVDCIRAHERFVEEVSKL